MDVSAIILAKNEEKNIKKCLKSLSWCDEIIIIDDNSTDKTVQIAQKVGAKVYKRDLNKNFAAQRNFGLEKANNRWVLYVDADEVVSKKLQDEIISRQLFINNYSGCHIERRDVLWGRRLKHGGGNIKLLRFAKKNSGKWERAVHEVWKVKGKTTTLKEPLLHHPHSTVGDFLKQINFYTDLHAQENKKEHKKFSFFKIIFYPPLKFINIYFFKQGFRDGLPGFVVAMMMSWHSFLAWSKLWLQETD